MYSDTYTKFNTADFKYGQYLQTVYAPKTFYSEWDYGDIFKLDFNIGHLIEALPDYYNKLKVSIYNFRYNLMYESELFEINDSLVNGVFSISIDEELSNKLIKGTYYCKIEALGEFIKASPTKCTLIRPSDCVLHVR